MGYMRRGYKKINKMGRVAKKKGVVVKIGD